MDYQTGLLGTGPGTCCKSHLLITKDPKVSLKKFIALVFCRTLLAESSVLFKKKNLVQTLLHVLKTLFPFMWNCTLHLYVIVFCASVPIGLFHNLPLILIHGASFQDVQTPSGGSSLFTESADQLQGSLELPSSWSYQLWTSVLVTLLFQSFPQLVTTDQDRIVDWPVNIAEMIFWLSGLNINMKAKMCAYHSDHAKLGH